MDAAKVEEISGFKPRQTQRYVEADVVIVKSQGQGVPREYTAQNVFELLIVKELVDNGVAFNRIKQIMQVGREKRPEMFNMKTYKNTKELYCITVYKNVTFYGATSRDEVTGQIFKDMALVPMEGQTSAIIVNVNMAYERVKNL